MRPAIIGAQTSIEGSVVGAEELIIDGQVTGTVEYKCNRVSIGSSQSTALTGICIALSGTGTSGTLRPRLFLSNTRSAR